MNFIRITTVREYHAGPLQSYAVLGKKIGIFQNDDGGYYALETNCKHHGADLLAGTIAGNIVTCPRHDWRYDLRTGQCLSNDSPRLRRYDVIVSGENLMMATVPCE